MQDLFLTPVHQEHFEREGWVLVPGFGADALAETQAVFEENGDPQHEGFRATLHFGEPERKARISAFFAERYCDALNAVLQPHQVVAGYFVSKGSDDKSVVPAHQDWAFVDERQHRSLNVWMPLCATTPRNGALELVAGSHRLENPIRGTGVGMRPGLDPASIAEFFTVFPMQAGDAIFYDHRVLHRSAINRSGKPRVAITLSVIPAAATPVHYVPTESGSVLELQVGRDFYDAYRVGEPVDSAAYPSREVAEQPVALDLPTLAAVAHKPKRRRRLFGRR